MLKVRLVTDSTCDLPPDLVLRYGVLVVPAVLNMEGKSYRDGVDISRADYYARLPGLKALPTTAAPAAGEFEAVYREGRGPAAGPLPLRPAPSRPPRRTIGLLFPTPPVGRRPPRPRAPLAGPARRVAGGGGWRRPRRHRTP